MPERAGRWIPGSRFARPGMTTESYFFSGIGGAIFSAGAGGSAGLAR